jgi:integrase
MALTVKRVQRLKRPGRHGDGHGLYLQVTATGIKSWIFRYERDGREKFMGLGPLHTVDLAAARARARAARLQLLDGLDPLEVKRSARAERKAAAAQQLTFRAAAEGYFNQHEVKWKSAIHRQQFLSSLRDYALPIIGDLPVAAIDTPRVLRVLEQPVRALHKYPAGTLWAARRQTADRVRGRIESVLDWCTVRGYRTGDNPARWRGHLVQVMPAARAPQPNHHTALPYAEIGAVVAALRGREGTAARALEFTILTAARSGEVTGARWAEIDWDTATWTVPASRMKAGREHRVPLTSAAVSLLQALSTEASNPYVFIGGRPGAGLSTTALYLLLKRMGIRVSVHGFRSTFRDWAGERTAAANHIIELCLAHAVGSSVERAYARSDLLDARRRLMEAWAAFCSAPAPTAAVVPLRGLS